MWGAAALAGLIHVLFFCMESLWWTKPAVYRRFRSTEAQALVTKSLAFNQGFYNLFLAVGVLGGLVLVATGHGGAGMILAAWSCASMLAAAVVLFILFRWVLIPEEERQLVQQFGKAYEAYQKRKLPLFPRW